MAGSVAGVLAAVITQPADTIKTRMQVCLLHLLKDCRSIVYAFSGRIHTRQNDSVKLATCHHAGMVIRDSFNLVRILCS